MVTLSTIGTTATATNQSLGSVNLGPGGSYLLGIFPVTNGVIYFCSHEIIPNNNARTYEKIQTLNSQSYCKNTC